MQTQTTFDVRLECDERELLLQGSSETLAKVPWPDELYTAETEPDYAWLTDAMTFSVLETLGEMKVTVPDPVKLQNAVRRAVEPGGYFEESQVTFQVEMPTAVNYFGGDGCTCRLYDDGDGESGPHLSVDLHEGCPTHGRTTTWAKLTQAYESWGPEWPEPHDEELYQIDRVDHRWGSDLRVTERETGRELFKVEVWRPREKFGQMQTEGEVNWQAIGDTSPAVTRMVAKAMAQAADLAETLEPEQD